MKTWWSPLRPGARTGAVDVRRYAVIGVAMLTLCAVIGAGTVSLSLVLVLVLVPVLVPVPVPARLAAAVIFTASGTVVAGTPLLPWARIPVLADFGRTAHGPAAGDLLPADDSPAAADPPAVAALRALPAAVGARSGSSA